MRLIYLTFHFWQSISDTGLSGKPLPTHSLPSTVTFIWHDIKKKKLCIFSQQTTRDSKRRASKEASALSKDGQSVSEDPEAVECVWWKMESRRSLWRGGRWCEQVICSLSLEADALLDPGHRSHRFPTQAPASCLRPKIPGCCIFVVPLQVHEWSSKEWLTNSAHALHRAFFSRDDGAGQGVCHCDKPTPRKKTQIWLSHTHTIIVKICTSDVLCVRRRHQESL